MPLARPIASRGSRPDSGAASASQNTDTGPVTLTQSLSQLRSVDEAPYTAAIAAGAALVMVSWAVYPALDAHHPAGLSATVVQQELRGRLGFTGVTLTDALEAGAIDSSYTTAQRAVLAAGAGMDLLLCSARDVGQGEDAVTGLVDALGDGTLDATEFDAAVRRVTALRARPARVDILTRFFGSRPIAALMRFLCCTNPHARATYSFSTSRS